MILIPPKFEQSRDALHKSEGPALSATTTIKD
jgi:hypothetical protein